MLQKEKHEKIICEIALNGDTFGVSKMSNLPVACDSIRCEICLFNEIGCALGRQAWLNSEYTEPKRIFTEEQKNFIRAFDKIKFLARDKIGSLWGYTIEPIRKTNSWDTDNCDTICRKGISFQELAFLTSIDFPQIKWEDKKPTSREEILGE